MTGALDAVYKIGMVLGILGLYSILTWGIGAMIIHDEYDALPTAIAAWLIGAFAFLILACYTLSLLGRWG